MTRHVGLVVDIVKEVYQRSRDHDLATYAASLAYHGVLALFPFLLFLLALVGFLGVPSVLDRLIYWSGQLLPPAAMLELIDFIASSRTKRNAGLISLAVLTAVWAAGCGIRAAMTALNRAYDIEESRPAVRRYLLSLGYTLGIGLLVVLAMSVFVIGPRIAGWAAAQFRLHGAIVTGWSIVRYPIALLLIIATLTLTYRLLPARGESRVLTPGAVVSAFLWIGISLGFQLYLANFGKYNVLYGSVGAVIVLLLYFWLSSLVMLTGGELNAVTAKTRAGETK